VPYEGGGATLRVAVVTPAFNAAATIADTIASVLAQTHEDVRLIVVDDGSADDTAAIAARFEDPRIDLLRQPNAGVSAARNRGLIAAGTAAALLFLDADDWLAPTALATLVATLRSAPQAVAAVGPFAYLDSAASRPRLARYRPARDPIDLLPGLVVQNSFANGGHVLIRGAALHRAGGFRPGIAYGEDWEFFIRLALLGPFAFAAGAAPVLFVRSCPDGAYRRLAADHAAFGPCMQAIFANPDLVARYGPRRVAALRRCAEAENAWIVGREQIRHGRVTQGWRSLAWSVAVAPSPRRLALLCAAAARPLLPNRWRGPFRSYG